jgi:aspartate/methionine/tyrosine aminotransferase
MKNLELTSWEGRFPENDIISLLRVNRRFNLAESTSRDLYFSEIMDLIGPEAVQDLRLGYGSAQGFLHLREEIGKLCNTPPDTVVSTNGAVMALYLLAIELCRPGDEVIIFTPCFPPSRDTLTGSGINPIEVPLEFDEGYRVNLDTFRASITANTRLVSLATPQNPSGVDTSHQEIQSILRIMETTAPEAWLFIDETYAHATYGNDPALVSTASMHPKIITSASISKSFGAPGLRVGWLTVSDADLRERLMVAKMNIVISGSPLDETLAAHILKNREAILGPRRDMLTTAFSMVSEWQHRNAEFIDWVRPTAGAMCCIRLSKTAFDDAGVTQFWASLESHELQLASGDWFGETDRIFRLGFGYLPLEELETALSKLEMVLRTVAQAKDHHGSLVPT